METLKSPNQSRDQFGTIRSDNFESELVFGLISCQRSQISQHVCAKHSRNISSGVHYEISNLNSIKGKVIIVGDGAKNLGGLISRDMAAQGAAPVTVHYNGPEMLEAACGMVDAVKTAGAKAIAVQCELTRPENGGTLFDATLAEFGQADIAINTTGMVIKRSIVDVSESEYEYDKIFALNSKAAFSFIQETGQKLADRGKIYTVVSSLLAAYTGSYAIDPGCMTPIEHYTRADSKEFGARGISVTAIDPEPIETPFFTDVIYSWVALMWFIPDKRIEK